MLRALRVSRLTICPLGQPEKAIGLEPQIEPWLAIYNHTTCLRQKSLGLVYASAMHLRKRKITDPPLYELGWMAGRISSLPPVAGEVFLLTSPFIERANRTCEFQVSGNPTNRDLAALQPLLGRTEQVHCCKWLCRPWPVTIDSELRWLSGPHFRVQVVVVLFRVCALPILVQRITLGDLDVRSAREDGVLLCATAPQYEIFHAIHLVGFGRVHMSVEHHDV